MKHIILIFSFFVITELNAAYVLNTTHSLLSKTHSLVKLISAPLMKRNISQASISNDDLYSHWTAYGQIKDQCYDIIYNTIRNKKLPSDVDIRNIALKAYESLGYNIPNLRDTFFYTIDSFEEDSLNLSEEDSKIISALAQKFVDELYAVGEKKML